MADLLTARDLVAELKRRGIGDWTPGIVRHWIVEEPPLPVAQRGRPGQPHKYNPDVVAQWLRDRDARMGYATASADHAGAPAAQAEHPSHAPEPTDTKPPPAPVDANDPTAVRVLLERARGEAEYNPTVEELLAVLKGRDPRNWKAAEDAYLTKLKRLEAQGYLVSVDDMRACLDAQVQIFRTGVTALRNQLKAGLAGLDDDASRESVVDEELDLMLERVADAARSAAGREATDAA